MFELKHSYLSFEDDLVSVINLRGYLLIKPTIVHAFLVNLLSLREVCRSQKGVVFAYEFYRKVPLIAPGFFHKALTIPAFMTFCKRTTVITE